MNRKTRRAVSIVAIALIVAASFSTVAIESPTHPTVTQSVTGVKPSFPTTITPLHVAKRPVRHPRHHTSIRRVRNVSKRVYRTFTVTAYTANDASMNGLAITASGTTAIPWTTVSASKRWPIGTEFKTPNGRVWVVSDRGGGITAADRLDLYVGRWDTDVAMDYGVRKVTLEIVKVGREGR